MEAMTKQLKEELDKLLPKIGNIVDDTCVLISLRSRFISAACLAHACVRGLMDC